LSLNPTVRQILAARNKKSALFCAEAVEDGSTLWKSEEN
jgi:hypothetical protein